MRVFTIALFILSAACRTELPQLEASYAPDGLEIILPAVGTIAAGSPVRAVVATRAPIGEVAGISADVLPMGATLSDRGDGSALFSWTPVTSQVGEHAIEFMAVTAKREATGAWSLTVTGATDSSVQAGEDANAPPVLTTGIEYWLIEGSPYVLPLDTYDADGDPVSVTSNGGDPGVSLSHTPLELSANFPASGLYSATLLLDDGEARISTTIWFHVQPQGNFPPRFVSYPSDVTLPGGVAWAVSVLTDDPNGDPVMLSVNGPSGMAFAGNELQWTPPHHGFGSATVQLAASDGVTSVTYSFDVHVEDAANSAPVPQTIPVPSAYQGADVTFQVAAIDPESDAVAYSLGATAPPFSSIAPDGTITWAVPASQGAGTAFVPVVATDSYGAAATEAYAVYVNLNTPPVIYPALLGEARRYSTYSKSTHSEDFDFGQSMTLSLVTAPTGMTLARTATTTYTLSWTPTVHNGYVDVGFLAEDIHGARTYRESLLYVPNGSPEVAVGFADNQACIGTPKDFTVTASDPDGDSVGLSGDGDLVLHGSPVTGGTAYFTGINPDDTDVLAFLAQDGFGGTALTEASFRIRGFRDGAGISNLTSELAGTKVALQATGDEKGAAFLWRNQPSTIPRMYRRVIGKDGCSTRSVNEDMIYDPVADGATYGSANSGRVHIQNDVVLTSYTVYGQQMWGFCGSANKDKYVLYLTLAPRSGGNGPTVCLFTPASTNSDYSPDPSNMSFTGSNGPESLHCTMTFANNTMYCRLVTVGINGSGDATIAFEPQFTFGNVTKTQWDTTYDDSTDYFLTWRDAASGYLRMAGRSKDNTPLFAGAVASLTNQPIAHPRVAALGTRATVHLYEKGDDLLLVPVDDVPAAGVARKLDSLQSGFSGRTALRRVPGTQRVVSAWERNGAVYVQANDYDALLNRLTPAWGTDRILVEQSPNLRSLTLFTSAQTVALAWLEESAQTASRYRPVVRFLNAETGGFYSSKLYITTRSFTEAAFSNFYSLADGVSISWNGGNLVYTEWRGPDGRGRP